MTRPATKLLTIEGKDSQAHVGPHVSAVQYELDGIVHGLMANPDRKFVYCEMVLSDKYMILLS